MNNLNIIIQRYLLDRYNTGSLVFLPTRSFYSYQQGALQRISDRHIIHYKPYYSSSCFQSYWKPKSKQEL